MNATKAFEYLASMPHVFHSTAIFSEWLIPKLSFGTYMTERPIVRPKRAESKPGAVLPSGVMWPFVLLTSCFAWWGLANNMTDTLLAAFKRIQSMSDSQTSLIQIAFYGSYFCFALPAAVFIKKYSYKSGVLLGRISWFRSISLRAASRYLKLPVRSKYSGH